ncbi:MULTISPECIES: hypothetical protein [Rhizobium]|uniref:Uncharacterized protein n=1 Tax=Rhizobium straminoryzae TaxID=1387186 RepID=A0A549TIR6_9HYPH|nr:MULTISPECIES: hypothetical protein [Rhizobium]MBT9368286.1 hypothetical protein [Rhizobium sp. CSW-27]TRL43454.1 hypothetical protein FNA46_00135 [Rhizobium straminoryzae]SIP89272.1 hypothetical protein SAMN05880590_10135 [Rhizobium sp. RU35A]
MRVKLPYRLGYPSVRLWIGRDKRGRWLVCDGRGTVGGIFADRASAVHAAMYESDGAPCSVCCLPEQQSLDIEGEIVDGVPPDLLRRPLLRRSD